MAIPVSTWALVAGLGASGVTVLFGRAVLNPEVPQAVLWLGAWGALFAAQAASWTFLRQRAN